MKDKSEPESIVFKYTKANDYRIVTANGAYGGPEPTGGIKVDFFIESLEYPNLQRFELEGTKLGKEVRRIPGENNWVRELQIGLLLSRDVAETIGNWLLEKVKQSDEARAKAKRKLTPGLGGKN